MFIKLCTQNVTWLSSDSCSWQLVHLYDDMDPVGYSSDLLQTPVLCVCSFLVVGWPIKKQTSRVNSTSWKRGSILIGVTGEDQRRAFCLSGLYAQ